MPNNALSESFDNGTGAIGNAWNVDTSVKGQVTLSGGALMEWASGRDAGHGYGTYTITAKLDGNQPGSAILLWPGDDKWPGQEIDIVETTPDGSGRQYGALHWNNNGSDAFTTRIFDGVQGGVSHDYQLVWEPGRITYKVDGVEKGVVTENVPADFDHGGMNNVIGFLNNNPSTSLTVSHVDFTPLSGGAATAAAAPVAFFQAPAPAQPAAPAPAPAPAAQSGPIDWNALAAQATANHDATGAWFI